MIEVIWEFRVKPQHVAEFERHYSGKGPWATLFGSSPGYYGTKLLRDREDPLRFLTIDTWDDFAAYEGFRADHTDQYRELDSHFERLTGSERLVGIFEVL
jgi:quinol monooxygenase YgiN